MPESLAARDLCECRPQRLKLGSKIASAQRESVNLSAEVVGSLGLDRLDAFLVARVR